MKQYLDLLKAIQEHGAHKPAARENMPGSQSLFGYQNRYDLADGFPAVTTKKLAWKSVVTELAWFLKGDSNIKFLIDNGCNIWNEDAYQFHKRLWPEAMVNTTIDRFIQEVKKGGGITSAGKMGYQYPKTWRNLDGNDQIANLIHGLRNNPESRRHVVAAIDPYHSADKDVAVYPCHSMFQFNCRPTDLAFITHWYDENRHFEEGDCPEYTLDCQLYQRSADSVLGVPFNIASYSLLTHIIAKMCNMIPGDFIHSFGDAHIYDNHKEAVKEQLSRAPGSLPTLKINSGNKNWQYLTIDEVVNSIDLDLTFTLENYNPQPAIKAKLSTGL